MRIGTVLIGLWILSGCEIRDCSKEYSGPAIFYLVKPLGMSVSGVDMFLPDGDSVRLEYGKHVYNHTYPSTHEYYYYELPLQHKWVRLKVRFTGGAYNTYKIIYDTKISYHAACEIVNYTIVKREIFSERQDSVKNVFIGDLSSGTSYTNYTNVFNQEYKDGIEVRIGD